MSEGHLFASDYPICEIWAETRIVNRRHAAKIQIDAVIMQSIIGSVLSKEGGKNLSKLLKEFENVD